MGVLDVQRNHMPVFQIRFGEKITRNGKSFPSMMEKKIRVTSANRQVVNAFTALYGGESRPWNDTQYEAYLPITEIPIMVLPGQSVNQWWEQYKGGVCERRCEGTGGIEQKSGKPCMCNPNVEQRQADKQQCSLMTRLNFLCPEVEVVGAGSLVTHGMIAAETLPQSVAVAEAALRQGRMVPAMLRSVTKVGKARQYVVPQIEIVGLSYQALMSGNFDSSGPQLSGRAEGAIGPSVGASTQAQRREPEDSSRALPAPATATVETSDSPPASDAMRSAIAKQAGSKGLSDDSLADLSLEVTGKYVEEVDFSVEDANKLLEAIGKAVQS